MRRPRRGGGDVPTGGGKSICYQLPALLADTGVAIVVSPPIALMQDQTQALVANGIPAAAIHSNQSEAENAGDNARGFGWTHQAALCIVGTSG